MKISVQLYSYVLMFSLFCSVLKSVSYECFIKIHVVYFCIKFKCSICFDSAMQENKAATLLTSDDDVGD